MSKVVWRPGNMLYPLPAVMATVGCGEDANIITIAWTGTVCSDPPMAYISVRPERHSYQLLKNHPEFVINLTTKDLAYATDFCGVKSGAKINKWEACHLDPEPSEVVKVPGIAQSPVHIECQVEKIMPLGTHDMFLAKVVSVSIDPQYMDERGKFHLDKADPIVYSHGQYYSLRSLEGHFGYSVRKKTKK